MSDAGHVLWKCSYASLFLSLILFFSLPATTVALNVSYSAPTQCGPFQIAWDDSVVLFDLSILPFNDRPVFPPSLTLIAAPRDPITKTYNYTFNELPLKSGTQFVVLMNYGFAVGTGGVVVSLIQTVGDSSDSSCLSTDPSPMSSFFALNPPIPSQCSTQTVSWNATRYPEAPQIRVLIPGGQSFKLDRPTTNTTQFKTWVVSVREETQMLLLVQPTDGSQTNVSSRTSPLITVTANSNSRGEDCLSINEFRSTVTLSSTTATSTTAATTIVASITTLPESTKPAQTVSTPAIIGGVVGGLGAILIICAAIVLYRLSTRKRKTSAFESLGAPAVFPSGVARAPSMRKQPLDAQEHPPLSLVTTPSVSMEPTGTDDGDDDGDQLVGGRARTDGRPRRDEGWEDVMETQYVRHTDAGAIGVIELPPSYHDLPPR